MRESFIFYKSFYDAIDLLGEKAQLKLYKAIMTLNFNCAENVTEMERICDEIETVLSQNRHTFAQFLLIKPQIMANISKYFNGRKGADGGQLGGAPKGNKNAQKTTPKQPLMKMSNVNVNENAVGVVYDKTNSTSTPPSSTSDWLDGKKKNKGGALVENSTNEVEFFGDEYQNVGLTDKQRRKLLGICASEKLLNELINALSRNIETGKEQPFNADLPNAHYERLKSYHKQRIRYPDRGGAGEEPGKFDPVMARLIEEDRAKYGDDPFLRPT